MTILRREMPATAMLLMVLAVGCGGTYQTRNTTSVVDYLYPKADRPVVTEQIPVLTLPLRVGVAFVPASGNFRYASAATLTEIDRQNLLRRVADHFESRPFVDSIEVIPSAYLQPEGSFGNLDQIRTMYGIDLIALVSFDQSQFTDQGFLSVTYWTIVGAYLVPGEKDSTTTMLDTVVFDIPSRKFLFRAPGTSTVKGRATPVNRARLQREDSVKGFDDAAEMMIANLDEELDRFKDRVRDRPDEIQIVESEGYSGGGALGPAMILLFAALAGSSLWLTRNG